MNGNSQTVEIDSPPEVVFECITDPGKLKQWLGGLKELRLLTEGELGPGTRFVDVYDEGGGRTMELTSEVVAYEPNRRIKIKGTNAAFDLTAEYVLTEMDGRTRVELTSEVRFKKLIYKLMAPLVGKAGEKKLREDFARLKALAESQSGRAGAGMDTPPQVEKGTLSTSHGG